MRECRRDRARCGVWCDIRDNESRKNIGRPIYQIYTLHTHIYHTHISIYRITSALQRLLHHTILRITAGSTRERNHVGSHCNYRLCTDTTNHFTIINIIVNINNTLLVPRPNTPLLSHGFHDCHAVPVCLAIHLLWGPYAVPLSFGHVFQGHPVVDLERHWL